MSLSNELDERIKKRNSLIFRIIIIAYALTIVVRYSDYFLGWQYSLFVVYFLFFLFFSQGKRFFRVLRLINDFAFLTFITYKAGHSNIHVSFILLLPLINALNHTDKSLRKAFSPQLFFLTIFSYFISNHLVIDLYFLVPLGAVALINILIAIRLFLNRINNSLDFVIENFYYRSASDFKSYKLITTVVKLLNENKFLHTFLKVKRVTFFKIKPSFKPYLTMSSEFVNTYDLTNFPNELNFIYKENIEGYINGEKIENGIIINLGKVNQNNSSNVVLIEFKKRVINLLLSIFIEKLLIPTFSRIITINKFEIEIQSLKRKFIQKSKEEFENIDSAANAVHYLGNKLTPVTNYFKMLHDLKNNKIPQALQTEWSNLIEADFERANKNIKHIQDKMLQIAQFTSSRNIIVDFELISVKTFVSYLRKTFLDACFCSTELKIEMTEHYLTKNIHINSKALDFVFVEFIDNFNKHSESEVLVQLFITEDKQNLGITLSNKIKNYRENAALIAEYVRDFNEGEVNELLQRKGNKGIKFLKQFLKQANIKHSCHTIDGTMNINLLIALL